MPWRKGETIRCIVLCRRMVKPVRARLREGNNKEKKNKSKQRRGSQRRGWMRFWLSPDWGVCSNASLHDQPTRDNVEDKKQQRGQQAPPRQEGKNQWRTCSPWTLLPPSSFLSASLYERRARCDVLPERQMIALGHRSEAPAAVITHPQYQRKPCVNYKLLNCRYDIPL